jgi:hypothetical protein
MYFDDANLIEVSERRAITNRQECSLLFHPLTEHHPGRQKQNKCCHLAGVVIIRQYNGATVAP